MILKRLDFMDFPPADRAEDVASPPDLSREKRGAGSRPALARLLRPHAGFCAT
jgi:hypothetical protein